MRPVAALLLLALAAPAAAAEEPACAPGARFLVDGLGTPFDDLGRAAEITGAAELELAFLVRAGPRLRTTCQGGPAIPWAARLAPAPDGKRWWAILPTRLDVVANSAYPAGGNDGLLWGGRGFSTMVSGGVAARYGAFSAALAPAVAWQQNDWFQIVPTGAQGDLAFANPFYGTSADLPQRFGAGPYASVSPGESFLRADAFGVGVGVSTERLRLGPGIRNTLLMSGTAPGFPHVFLETARPVDIRVGRLEAHVLWGELRRSDYFADGGGRPWLAALALGFEPGFAPGLQLGLGRVAVLEWDALVDEWFVPFFGGVVKGGVGGTGGEENSPEDNQIGVLWFRWAFPASGVEIYAEWGKEDREVSTAGFTRELDRTSAWVAGFQKVFAGPERWVRVHAEVSKLQNVRPGYFYSWYTHPNDLSYTHEGQLLGAWVGPGGSSQTLAVDVFGRSGRLGGFLERVVRNEAYYWEVVAPVDDNRDVEFGGGLRGVSFLGPLDVSWEAAFAYRWHRDFMERGDANFRGLVQVAYRAR